MPNKLDLSAMSAISAPEGLVRGVIQSGHVGLFDEDSPGGIEERGERVVYSDWTRCETRD